VGSRQDADTGESRVAVDDTDHLRFFAAHHVAIARRHVEFQTRHNRNGPAA